MDEALAAARLAVELEDGLCLIFVVGPADRAREGLEFVRARLPEGPTTWHRLDRDGLDLEASMRGAGERGITLVHGLERLCDDDRLWAASLLNLHRDKLERARGALVLWIPDDHMLTFVKRAPDLYAWRSMVLQVNAADVPIPDALAWRRRFLLATLRSLDFIEPPTWWADSDLGRMTNRGYFIEPAVIGPDGQEMTLSAWAAERKLGLITGPPGSGRRTALFWLAWRAADRALDDPDAPIPLVVWERDSSSSRLQAASFWWLVSTMCRRLGLSDRFFVAPTRFVLFADRRTTNRLWPGLSVLSLEELGRLRSICGLAGVFATGEASEGSAGWTTGGLCPWDHGRMQAWRERGAQARAPGRRSLRDVALQTMFKGMSSDLLIDLRLAWLGSERRAMVLAETPHVCFGDVALNELGRALVRLELVDAAAFEALVQEYPRREPEIRAVAAVWADPASLAPAGTRPRIPSDMRPSVMSSDTSPMSSRPLLLSEGAWRLDNPANVTAEELEALFGRIGERRHTWDSRTAQPDLAALALHVQGDDQTKEWWDLEATGGVQLAAMSFLRRDQAIKTASLGYTRTKDLVEHLVLEFEGGCWRFSFPIVQRWYAAHALARLTPEQQRELCAGRERDPAWAELLRLIPREPDPPDPISPASSANPGPTDGA